MESRTDNYDNLANAAGLVGRLVIQSVLAKLWLLLHEAWIHFNVVATFARPISIVLVAAGNNSAVFLHTEATAIIKTDIAPVCLTDAYRKTSDWF